MAARLLTQRTSSLAAEAAGHRHRAQFARSGDELPVRLCQFDAKLREQVAVDASLPVLGLPIAASLRCIERLSAEATPLWQRLGGVEAHSTSCGGICVTLAYRPETDRQANTALPPPPDPDGWMAADASCARAAGRAPTCCKRLSSGDGAATGSCAARRRRSRTICALRRSHAAVGSARGPVLESVRQKQRVTQSTGCARRRGYVLARRADVDLLELHSGFGASTVALASCFRRVLSVEIFARAGGGADAQSEAQRHRQRDGGSRRRRRRWLAPARGGGGRVAVWSRPRRSAARRAERSDARPAGGDGGRARRVVQLGGDGGESAGVDEDARGEEAGDDRPVPVHRLLGVRGAARAEAGGSRAARSADVAWRIGGGCGAWRAGSGGHAIYAHRKGRIADAAARSFACAATPRRVARCCGGHASGRRGGVRGRAPDPRGEQRCCPRPATGR